jgi:excisionase family DNA binding protein
MATLYKASDVAKMLSVSPSFIYKKAEKNELESLKIGTSLRFTESQVQSYLEKCVKRRQPSNDPGDRNAL